MSASLRQATMEAWVVLASYVPEEGQEETVLELLRGHVPLLREEGLATERGGWILRAEGGGSLHEIFEWASIEAAVAAESNDRVQEVWKALAEASTFTSMADLDVGQGPFAHFQVI